jgi:hypothetical protein
VEPIIDDSVPLRPSLGQADLLTVLDRADGLAPGARAAVILSVALPDVRLAELLELSLGQRDRLLLDLLASDFAAELDGVTECVHCGGQIAVTVSCEQLRAAPAAAEPIPVAWDGRLIDWRCPSSADLLAASDQSSIADATDVLLHRCVLSPVDEPIPPGLRAALVEAIEACDPVTDIVLDVVCPDCGTGQLLELDVGNAAWQEINSRAIGLLQEIDMLARTYGWTEPEILALSPARRRAYLELADA